MRIGKMPFLSSICRLCGQYQRCKHALCEHCQSLLEPLGAACEICAARLPHAKSLLCGSCLVKRPVVDKVFTAYHFSEPLRTLMHAFKYQGALELTSLFVDMLLQAVAASYVTECLLPIPLHRQRLQNRGFNQAAVLTVALSKQLRVPYDLYSCVKTKLALPQAGLSAQQRQHNLQQAFRAAPLPYQHVTLIDDLYTTGATSNEMAGLLKQQGVKQVNLLCCARSG